MHEGSEEAGHADVWRVFWQHSKFKDRGGSFCDVDIRKPEALEQSEGAESSMRKVREVTERQMAQALQFITRTLVFNG